MPQRKQVENKGKKIRHLRKGDTVYVLAGKDYEKRLARVADEELEGLSQEELRKEADKRPGKRGKVIGVLPERGKVLVDGVNMVTKHAKPRGRAGRTAQMQTGRISQPAAIDVSNVMLVCPHPGCERPTRVSYRVVEGKRVRVCKRCGEAIDLS